MENQMFDSVRFEKERAIAKFNRFRRIVKLWQIFEVLAVLGLISWSSARVPAVLSAAGEYFVEFSACLFNHHVVFLIGNAIIVLLFMLCRQNDANLSGGGDFYDDYVKYNAVSHPAAESAGEQTQPPTSEPEIAPAAESAGDDEEKQIVVREQEAKAISQCDDVAEVIEKATKQIKRFQRAQSEKLKQEISVRPQPRRELRRSETENRRKKVISDSVDAAEIEKLSNEEFRRRVDAFIDKHWSKRKTQQRNPFENRQLVQTA